MRDATIQIRRTLPPPRAERHAPHVDCDDGSCGACDRCLYEHAVYLPDHPPRLTREELARL